MDLLAFLGPDGNFRLVYRWQIASWDRMITGCRRGGWSMVRCGEGFGSSISGTEARGVGEMAGLRGTDVDSLGIASRRRLRLATHAGGAAEARVGIARGERQEIAFTTSNGRRRG